MRHSRSPIVVQSRIPVLVATLGLLMGSAQPAGAQVVINEVMADNRTAVAHHDAFPDYLELHNASDAAVNLEDWSLSDDPALPRRFVFPAGSVIAPRGYLLVWADTRTDLPGLHAGFGLGLEGDAVRLYSPNSLVVDQIVFGLQAADLSIGRVPDGSGAWTLTTPSAGSANTAAALGNYTGLRFNEWMARPATGEDWLELFSSDSAPVALSGLVVTDSLAASPPNRAIPALSFIAARGWVRLFASDLLEPGAHHLDFKLSADGETLTLFAPDRVTVIERLVYGAQANDVSQGRAPDGSDNIVSFPTGRATPGASNFAPLSDIVVSEVLTHTDPPLEDAIELHNTSAATVDVSGWWLSDSFSQPRKFRIPPGNTLAAGGYRVFYQYQFDVGASAFSLNSAEGDRVVLSKADAAGNLTGEQTSATFGPLRNGVSVGRHPTSASVDFVPLSRRTFGVDNPSIVTQFRQGTGLANALPRIGPVVISELMFRPLNAAGQDDPNLQFVELHNASTLTAYLYDQLYPTNAWRIRDGISFDLPVGLTLAPGGFLILVSFDPGARPDLLSHFRARFQPPANVLILGPFSGQLSSTGERIELLEPDTPQGPESGNPGMVPYCQAEFIRYSSNAPWPAVPAGSSLQKQLPAGYGNEPTNWIAVAASPGRLPASDTDGDGMTDSWEQEFGFDINDPADALLDDDGDGANNRDEYLAGTNPREAASVLAWSRVAVVDGGLQVRFNGAAGRTYSIQRRGGLHGTSWQTVEQIPASSSNQVIDRVFAITDPIYTFFRILTPGVP